MVSHLIRGGSGDRSGTVKPGDIIVSIDGEDLTSRGLGVMRNTLVGPEGSGVVVGFRRLTEGGEYLGYSVKLMRGTPGLAIPVLVTGEAMSGMRGWGKKEWGRGGGLQ